MRQVLLTQVSFEKSYSFVDLALPLGLRLCFSVTKSRKGISIVFISFKKMFSCLQEIFDGRRQLLDHRSCIANCVYILHNMKVACGIIATENEISQNMKGQEKFYG